MPKFLKVLIRNQISLNKLISYSSRNTKDVHDETYRFLSFKRELYKGPICWTWLGIVSESIFNGGGLGS